MKRIVCHALGKYAVAKLCLPVALIALIVSNSFAAEAEKPSNKQFNSHSWSQILPAQKRFVLVMNDQAVLDKETGLVWEKSPDTALRTWYQAVYYAYNKEVGGRKGWRLPTVEELASLVDTTRVDPALPLGHPFVDVQSSYYWSATTHSTASFAFAVGFSDGFVSDGALTGTLCVWCVRGGHGYDGY